MLFGKKFLEEIQHSAKGSTWDEHKYIKRIDGTYYYPDSYEGGRHLSSVEKKESESEDKENGPEIESLSSDDIEKLANEVIRGNFGNGQTRKELLGAHYQEIQDRVNEIYKSKEVGSKPVNSSSLDIIAETGKKAIDKVLETASQKSTAPATKGLDLDTVYAVYNKKK